MYTIKQAAVRSGVSITTIRAWERRYGVVEPGRTAAGYRLYDDASIERLAVMRHLVETEGWRPSQAAERVLAPGAGPMRPSGDPDASQIGLAPDDPTVDAAASAGLAIGSETDPARLLVAEFVSAAQRLDTAAMERILDEGFAAQRFELALEDVVYPALRALGDGWSTGDVDVAVEHAASETVRRRLARFHDAVASGTGVPDVVVGLPPGGLHEIGAFALAVALRRAGLSVLYLGANVPLDSWLVTIQETGAPVVALGVVARSDVGAAADVVEALRGLARPTHCALGGRLSRSIPQGPGVAWLPERIDAAVAMVVDVVKSKYRPADTPDQAGRRPAH
jgi:MerR family transcriptional regulator, light-induced transcriptional regulator